jgi:uncharacterized protein YdeI (YjbR/CyaY-like superfamily)
METKREDGITVFYPKTAAAWRAWLQKNAAKEKAVWLVGFKKSTGKPFVPWSETVDEALCFGWIDSVRKSRDSESYYQFFSPRKPKSKWSKINKEKVARLIEEKRMQPAGLAVVEAAKKSGTWDALNDVDAMIIPDDLQAAFSKNKTAWKYFDEFAPSSKRIILQWILDAKREETRAKRIAETVELAAKNIKAHHPK